MGLSMSRLFIKMFAVLFWIYLGFAALMPGRAQAAAHDLSGCLFVYDSRTADDGISDQPNPTQGTYVGVAELDIEVWFKAAGIWWKAGELTTSSTGCFAGTLKGLGVPANTLVQYRARMKSSAREVYLGLSAYYYQLGGDISVSSGQAADLGDFFIGQNSTPAEVLGVMTLWRTAYELEQDYVNHVGTWPSNLPRLSMEYPSSDVFSNCCDSGNLNIIENDVLAIEVLYHEAGHWLALWDDFGWSTSSTDYCTDYVGTAYPYTLEPYVYTDPDAPDCIHDPETYEEKERAAQEGFADFFADFVYDGKCNQRELYPLNFDGKNNETNISAALCDLADTDNQTVSFKHIYGQPGALEVVASGGGVEAFDTTNVYYSSGGVIVSLPLSGTSYTPNLVYSNYEGSNLAAANGHLCYKGNDIHSGDYYVKCGTLSSGVLAGVIEINVAPQFTGTTSDDYESYISMNVEEIVVAGDHVYALVSDTSAGYTVTVSAVDGSTTNGTTVFSGCLLEGCGSVAENDMDLARISHT